MRLPQKREIILVLMVCGFPIHFWAVFIFLHEFPAYLMHLRPAEIVGILAYALVHAMFESLLAAGILSILASLLPAQFLLEHFPAQGLILVVVTTLWLVPLHFWSYSLLSKSQDITEGNPFSLSSMFLPMLVWFLTYLLALIGLSIQMRRETRFEKRLVDLTDRFSIPSTLFFTIDIFCVGIVLVRNWL